MLQLRNKSTSKGPLWLVDKKYTLGSDSACDVKISSPGIQPQHAELLVNGDSIELVNLVGGSELSVNGQAVSDKARLKIGDEITLGSETLALHDPKSTQEKAPAKQNANDGWALKALNTALAEKHFPLKGSQTIGRSQDCDISLGVVHLSRKHASVAVTDKGLVVEDLNSSNGTYLNGKKVSKAKAIAGDEVSFDTLRFRVIGPIIDEDKTTVRPSSDGDLTTVRPALNVAEMAAAAGGKKAPPPAGAAKQKPKARPAGPVKTAKKPPRVESNAASSRSEHEEPKSMGVILAGVAVIVGAAVAWFFLK